MARRLQFSRLATVSIITAVLGLIITIIFALNGHGYWSLAWGSVISSVLRTALLCSLSPFFPQRWQRGVGTLKLLRFGASLTGANILNFINRNLDSVLIGRFCGTELLGLYDRAYKMLLWPTSNIRDPIMRVAFPAMSRLQGQPAELRDYFLKGCALIAFLSMPLVAFLGVTAAPVVELALGTKQDWSGVVPIFSVLAFIAFLQPVTGFVGNLLIALGQGRRYFYFNLMGTVTNCVTFPIGVYFGGPLGLAVAYVIGANVTYYPRLVYGFRKTPVRFSDFARAWLLPAGLSLVSAAVAFPIVRLLGGHHILVQISASGLVFALGCGVPFYMKYRVFIKSVLSKLAARCFSRGREPC